MLKTKSTLNLSQQYLSFEIVNNYFYPLLNVEFFKFKTVPEYTCYRNLLLFCLFKDNN